MTKLKHYLPLLSLALAATVQAQGPPPVKGVDPKVPEIVLPPFVPEAVVKFDGVRVRDLPWHVTAVKAPEAWAMNPAARGKGVRVAVLDTGGQANHPGINGMIKGEYNAITKRAGPGSAKDGHGHGTHCLGIVHSIAPDAELYAVKVLTDRGSGAVDVIAHGIDYATTVLKADVISLSLGGPSQDTFMPPAIKRAVAAGVIVVCAAGNDGGWPGRDTEGYPGRYPDSVSVAASDKQGKLASFSSWGPNVFTTKPGVDILSLLPEDKEGLMSGTSMACPNEAGCAASWIASNGVGKDLNRVAKYRRAVLSASPFKERTNAVGYGLYPLDKITGAAVPPPPPPGKPGSVTITFADLSAEKQAELKAGGVDTFRLEIGHAAKPAHLPPVSIPVRSVPPEVPAPLPVWIPPAQPWHVPPPQSMPQRMPSPCPGGVCPPNRSRPAPLPVWVPGTVFRRVFR